MFWDWISYHLLVEDNLTIRQPDYSHIYVVSLLSEKHEHGHEKDHKSNLVTSFVDFGRIAYYEVTICELKLGYLDIVGQNEIEVRVAWDL